MLSGFPDGYPGLAVAIPIPPHILKQQYNIGNNVDIE